MGKLRESLENKKKMTTMMKKKKKKSKEAERTNTELFQEDIILKTDEEQADRNKSSEKKKKRKREKGINVDAGKPVLISKDKSIKAEGEKNKNKLRKKKTKSQMINNSLVGKFGQLGTKVEDGFDKQNDDGAADQSLFTTQEDIANSKERSEAIIETEIRSRKSNKSKKKKRKAHGTSNESENILDKREEVDQKREEADQDEIYYMSSGDEDCSKGMKKWIMEYHQSRPGLKVLQQRIDEFMMAHEEKLEQERKEKQALLEEPGWTVVARHKGRKKTTDSESGITVGSVAQAVVEDQVAKKKNKEVGLNFYRFQRREAHRNEILTLQSKFEQDKKRIQQLRAARKFQPY